MLFTWIACLRERFFILKRLVITVVILLPVCSCDMSLFTTSLDKIKESGEVVVITRNAPTSYYENNDGEFEGLEYDMVMAFADYLKVKPRFITKNSAADVLNAVDMSEGHFAAAGLTKTDQRLDSYDFGPAYQRVQQQVVCRRNHGHIPSSMNDFDDITLWVSKNTSYEGYLRKVQEQYPDIKWQSSEEWGTEQLLEKVWKREIDCTVADSNIFDANRRYYPELVLAFSLSDLQPLTWILPPDSDELVEAMEAWYEGFSAEGKMEVLLERYYGFYGEYDYVETRRFRRSVAKVLPKYREWFEQAGEKYKLDWQLLAALSYQESHWNPVAKSPTGVRGIMMITRLTAQELKLENRLDPETSIFTGAKYLAQLRARLPDQIEEPERTWMTLAAYNMGYGHFRDARTLAKRLGKDQDQWGDIETVLPLLMQKRHYSTLRHGYARGLQALHYVNSIRGYRDQLSGILLQLTDK